MKKSLIILLLGLIVTTGCENSNKVVCTGKTEENGVSAEIKITGNMKSNKIDNADMEMVIDSEETAQFMCGMLALQNTTSENKIDYKCEGKKIVMKSVTSFDDVTDFEGYTKEEFIEHVKEIDSNITCK